MSKARFRISGIHLDGAKDAIITIDRERGVVECRPLFRPHVYLCTTQDLVSLVASHSAKNGGPFKKRSVKA